MILTQTHVSKLLVITLTLCFLTTSINAGKLAATHTRGDDTRVSVSTGAKVAAAAETATSTKEAKINSSEEDDEEDNDDAAETDDDNETEAAEKTAMQPAPDTSLSVWGIVSGLWNWIKEDIGEGLFDDDGKTTAAEEGRTFGKIRRLQMALIPIVFKFGVLSAMIAFLVAVSIKTLFLVKVLVVMNLLALLAKVFTFKSNFGHVEQFAAPPAAIWSPYASGGWHSTPEEHHVNKEIHLHIHGGHLQPQVPHYSYGSGAAGQGQGWEKRNDPYAAYDTMALQGEQGHLVINEVPSKVNSVAASGQQFASSFPGNHRMF